MLLCLVFQSSNSSTQPYESHQQAFALCTKLLVGVVSLSVSEVILYWLRYVWGSSVEIGNLFDTGHSNIMFITITNYAYLYDLDIPFPWLLF